MRRLDAARAGATGRQILTLPLLAARLAGGFIAPATQEILYPAIRQALEAGGYEDIDKGSQLPGMPVAVLSALRDWWDMEVPASLPDNARLRDFILLERRVRGTLPSGMLSPPGLVKTAAGASLLAVRNPEARREIRRKLNHNAHFALSWPPNHASCADGPVLLWDGLRTIMVNGLLKSPR